MSLALLFHYLMLNMFRMLIHPSSGACDLFVELFHGLYCSLRIEVLKLVSLYSTIKMMHGPINIRSNVSSPSINGRLSLNWIKISVLRCEGGGTNVHNPIRKPASDPRRDPDISGPRLPYLSLFV